MFRAKKKTKAKIRDAYGMFGLAISMEYCLVWDV